VAVFPSKRTREKVCQAKMVKIVDVEEEHDVSRDEDDCVEIDPAEFAKKLNLKETDDVILVSAKGKVSIF
jgi:formylmethanofuran dehydrogenase subunit D